MKYSAKMGESNDKCNGNISFSVHLSLSNILQDFAENLLYLYTSQLSR